MAAAAPPPEELVEEILLRIPPDDPALLLRTALVCKRWHRLVSDPGFRRRFTQFHRTPPMLGFFHQDHLSTTTARFTPTSSFHLPPPVLDDDHGRRSRRRVVDARHGLVLFQHTDQIYGFNPDDFSFTLTKVVVSLVVWSPITGVSTRLPTLRFLDDARGSGWNAALLCACLAAAAAGCDYGDHHHLACGGSGGGAFTVVAVGILDYVDSHVALVYRSGVGQWRWSTSTATVTQQRSICLIRKRSALVGGGGALCFLFLVSDGWNDNGSVLRYDLRREEFSVIRLPPDCPASLAVLMTTADNGGLWCASVRRRDLHLCMWARDGSSSDEGGWTQHKAVDLKGFQFIPDCAPPSDRISIIALADGGDIAFIKVVGVGVFTVDLESRRVRQVLMLHGNHDDVALVIPYQSFCTPRRLVAQPTYVIHIVDVFLQHQEQPPLLKLGPSPNAPNACHY